jgi:formate-dependent nitrite reductase membrane component NrfD
VGNLITGALSLPFWVGVVLVGLVLPLGTEVTFILRDVEHPPSGILVLLASMVLTGGFSPAYRYCLRWADVEGVSV